MFDDALMDIGKCLARNHVVVVDDFVLPEQVLLQLDGWTLLSDSLAFVCLLSAAIAHVRELQA